MPQTSKSNSTETEAAPEKHDAAPASQPVQTVVLPAAGQKKSKLLIFLLIGCLGLCTLVVCVIVVYFLFFSNSGISTSEYISKTEANYLEVDVLVQKVRDSIENDFGEKDSASDYQQMEDSTNNAYNSAAALQTKVEEVEKTIPAPNSQSTTADTKLRDYYTAAKDLGASYKTFVQFFKDSLPALSDFYDVSEAMGQFGSPVTVADFQALAMKVDAQKANLTSLRAKVANLSTTGENSYKKTSLLKTVDGLTDFLTAFGVFIDKVIPALPDKLDALNAASEEFKLAQTEFQTTSTSLGESDKTKTDDIKESYLSKADAVDAKRMLLDVEFGKLKALAN